jgi:hypothetical protein
VDESKKIQTLFISPLRSSCILSPEYGGFFTPASKPFGISYGQWTVRWWQWILSIPDDLNPALDETGKYAGLNQSDPNVWFLAGTFAGNTAHRMCLVPPSKAILFPIINYETNPLEYPALRTELALIEKVKEDIDDIESHETFVDGQRIPVYRVRSDPSIFSINLPNKNLFHVTGGGSTQASSDGYWVFLKPLAVGEHSIFFAGSCTSGSRKVRTWYNVKIPQS